jgi:hypothetical protein
MGTFKLQMKEGIEGQIRAQRQDDFVDEPDYSGKFPSQVPNYKGHSNKIMSRILRIWNGQSPENHLEFPQMC